MDTGKQDDPTVEPTVGPWKNPVEYTDQVESVRVQGFEGPTGQLLDGIFNPIPDDILRTINSGGVVRRVTSGDNPIERIIDFAEDIGIRVKQWQADSMRHWWGGHW